MAKFMSIKEMLTHEFLCDWLCTATCGSFWCDCKVAKTTPQEIRDKAKKNNECREDRWTDVLLMGGTLCILDEEERKGHYMTLADIEKGISTFVLNYPTQWAAIVEGQADLIDADMLLQYIIFGDVIYG